MDTEDLCPLGATPESTPIVLTTHVRLIRTGQHQNELHARLFNKAACPIYDHFDEAVERRRVAVG